MCISEMRGNLGFGSAGTSELMRDVGGVWIPYPRSRNKKAASDGCLFLLILSRNPWSETGISL